MSKVDIILAVIFLLGAYSGYKDGFLMSLFSILAIILGVLGGFKLMGIAMIYLQNNFHADKSTLPYISFFVVFIIIVVTVMLVGRILKSSLDKTLLGTMDKSLGACIGIFKMVFIVSIIIWLADSLMLAPPDAWISDSWIYPLTAKVAPATSAWVGSFIPFFKEIFQAY